MRDILVNIFQCLLSQKYILVNVPLLLRYCLLFLLMNNENSMINFIVCGCWFAVFNCWFWSPGYPESQYWCNYNYYLLLHCKWTNVFASFFKSTTWFEGYFLLFYFVKFYFFLHVHIFLYYDLKLYLYDFILFTVKSQIHQWFFLKKFVSKSYF